MTEMGVFFENLCGLFSLSGLLQNLHIVWFISPLKKTDAAYVGQLLSPVLETFGPQRLLGQQTCLLNAP